MYQLIGVFVAMAVIMEVSLGYEYFQIRLLDRDGCIDVYAGRDTKGTNVILWTCHQGDHQLWKWDGQSLVSKDSGKCLDVYGGGTAAGTSLIIWDCHSGSNQLWDLDNDNHLIIGEGSNKCIDVYDKDDTPGTDLIIWDCHSEWNQQWIFQFVTTSSITIFGVELLSLVYLTDFDGNVTYQFPITLIIVYSLILMTAICFCYFNVSKALKQKRRKQQAAKYKVVPVTSADDDEDNVLIN